MNKKSVCPNKPYHSFFKKRLQTQSFLDTEMNETNMSNLTNKIIKSLKSANVQGSRMRQKMLNAKNRQQTMQNQEEEQKKKLRQKIQDRMRISRTNLDKINSERRKALSSRSKFQQSQRKKIKEKQKKQMQETLLRATKYQRDAEKFFKDSEIKRKQQYKRIQNISPDTRYNSFYRTNSSGAEQSQLMSMSRDNQNIQSRLTSSKSLQKKEIKVLKVSDADIKQKQKKKITIEKTKENKYLNQYIRKMQEIMNIKKKSSKAVHEPLKPTLPKVIKNQRPPVIKYARKSHNQNSQYQYINHHGSFSEQYQVKLQQKLMKKQQFHSIIMNKGDQILEKERQRSKSLKDNKIIKDSINDYRRWSNFKRHL